MWRWTITLHIKYLQYFFTLYCMLCILCVFVCHDLFHILPSFWQTCRSTAMYVYIYAERVRTAKNPVLSRLNLPHSLTQLMFPFFIIKKSLTTLSSHTEYFCWIPWTCWGHQVFFFNSRTQSFLSCCRHFSATSAAALLTAILVVSFSHRLQNTFWTSSHVNWISECRFRFP